MAVVDKPPIGLVCPTTTRSLPCSLTFHGLIPSSRFFVVAGDAIFVVVVDDDDDVIVSLACLIMPPFTAALGSGPFSDMADGGGGGGM